MRLLSFLVLLLVTKHTYVLGQSEIVRYQLPEKHRVVGTNSAKLNDSTSLHLAITKNRVIKKFEVKPFLITNTENRELNSLYFDEHPRIISTHHSEGIITILYEEHIQHRTYREKRIYGIDIDIEKNLVSPSKEIKELMQIRGGYKTLINADNATYFFGEVNGVFFIFEVKNTKSITRKLYKIKHPVSPPLSTRIKEEKNTYIKTDEYVNVGSTSPSQIFKYGDTFYVTYDYDKTSETYMYVLPFGATNRYEVSFEKFSSSLLKNRIHKSFLTKEHLFQFSVGRKEAILDIHDHNTKKKITSFYYSSEQFGPYHEYYFKGEKTEPKENRFFKSFNKFGIGTTYFPAPFITVNRASDNGYVIEIGHVDKHSYYYDPFLHHRMMWQQQMMMNTMLPKFSPGPNPDDYPTGLFFYTETTNKTSLKLSLEHNFNVTETLSETVYSHIDHSETIKQVNTIATFRKLSHIQFEEFTRFMFFDAFNKSFFIRDKKAVKNQ